MDLFIVNRYLGDEEADKQNESKKLNKLLSKIEKRKRERKKSKNNSDETPVKKAVIEKNVTETKMSEEQSGAAEVNDVDKQTIDDTQIIEELITDKTEDSEHEIKDDEKVTADDKEIEGFTILGTEQFDGKKKVKRILPRWLTEPSVISSDLQNLKLKFRKMEQLDKDLKRKLKDNGLKYLFPVQATVIPWLIGQAERSAYMIPQDVCVSSPTGSGKTLAFVLPIVQILKNQFEGSVRALVVLPTQSLAMQIHKIFQEYCEGTGLTVALLTGSRSFQEEQKLLLYKNEAWGYLSKVDIVVCTPGRLVDHLKLTEGFCLRNLQFIVMDEADRMLDAVQDDWLAQLEDHLRPDDELGMKPCVLNVLALRRPRWHPQKLLFSATLSQDPEKLQRLSLFQPVLFTAAAAEEGGTRHTKYSVPRELTERYLECAAELKPLCLYKLLVDGGLKRTLVFTNSVQNVHRLCVLLQYLCGQALRVEEISSAVRLPARRKLMRSFAEGHVDILVSTDSLARGVDLPGVRCVVSYSAPRHLRTYVHRIGRTARAGEPGLAVTLLQPGQTDKFLEMLQREPQCVTLAEDELQPLGERYQQALRHLGQRVRSEARRAVQQRKRQADRFRKPAGNDAQ